MAENLDIVVFGGSFDPPHAGHEQMARLALTRASRLIFMPAHRSPLKHAQPARFEQRVRML
ncbi:MAG TPA: adenylyltransferase/cytidyltransferase family protein, partial [Leptospiraceae bacterium]|nr:adenylyltransferase/cytidyltransferase family protein [Leptospiraceae bacterium]